MPIGLVKVKKNVLDSKEANGVARVKGEYSWKLDITIWPYNLDLVSDTRNRVGDEECGNEATPGIDDYVRKDASVYLSATLLMHTCSTRHQYQ